MIAQYTHRMLGVDGIALFRSIAVRSDHVENLDHSTGLDENIDILGMPPAFLTVKDFAELASFDHNSGNPKRPQTGRQLRRRCFLAHRSAKVYPFEFL
nr:hypothetical protein [Porphyrobacter sp. AAP60]